MPYSLSLLRDDLEDLDLDHHLGAPLVDHLDDALGGRHLVRACR